MEPNFSKDVGVASSPTKRSQSQDKAIGSRKLVASPDKHSMPDRLGLVALPVLMSNNSCRKRLVGSRVKA